MYVPNRIISAICFPSVEVNTKFPHMDLMLGPNTTQVLSNMILNQIFGEGRKLETIYIKLADPNTEYKASVHKCKIQIVDGINIEVADVFVVVFEKKKQIKLKTLTHKGYSPELSGFSEAIKDILLKNPKGPSAVEYFKPVVQEKVAKPL